MESNGLDIRNVLEIIFRTTKKRGNILADCYLIKDPSIISKWKNLKAKPTNEDILKIVEFAYEESTETQRKIMRNEIINLLNGSCLKGVIRDSVISIEDFGEFLSEVLKLVTVVLGKDIQYDEAADSNFNTDDFNEVSGNVKNMIQMETISAFSEDIEGKYSGVIEFNMFLSKDRGESCIGRFENDTKNKSYVNKSTGSKPGKFQKKLKATVVLGTLFIVFFAFLAVDAATNAQNGKQKVIVSEENTNAHMKEVVATPAYSKETKEGKGTFCLDNEVNNQNNPILESQIPGKEFISKTSPKVEAEPKDVHQEQDKNKGNNQENGSVASKPSKAVSSDSPEKTAASNKIKSGKPKIDATENRNENSTNVNNTNTNAANADKADKNNTDTSNINKSNTNTSNKNNTGAIVNNIDNSVNDTNNTGDTIIEGDIIIEGEKNIVGKGSNVFITFE